jgi:hypothetical protein
VNQLRVCRFESVRISNVTSVPDSPVVHLNIAFSALAVCGRFAADFMCQCNDPFKQKVEQRKRTGEGNISQTVSNSELQYQVNVGDKLTLTGLTIPAAPSVSVDVTGGSDLWAGSWPVVMTDGIQKTVVNVFSTANFAQNMLATLHKKLGV